MRVWRFLAGSQALCWSLLVLWAVLMCLPYPKPEGPLDTLRTAWVDFGQRIFPRTTQSQPVTIVAIDEKSLKESGQWPWPRNRLSALLDVIAAAHPLAVGLDIYMPEPDATSPQALADSLSPGQSTLAQQLRKLPAHDALLAGAIQRAPTVLAVAGFSYDAPGVRKELRSAPVLLRGGDISSRLIQYPYVLTSLPELQAAASGQGVVSTALTSGVVHRLPLVVSINGNIVPSLGMEMLRVASGDPAIKLQADAHGLRTVQVAERTIATQTDGSLWHYFAPLDSHRYVSAQDVMTGKVAAEWFENKLVLIGLTGLGLADTKATPLGETVPGVEIHAQFLESIIEEQTLLRPAHALWVETSVLLLFGAGLIVLSLRWRVVPALMITALLLLVLIGASFSAFVWRGWLFDAASIGVGLLLTQATVFVYTHVRSEQQRLAAEAALQRERLAAAKVAGELDAARKIQMGVLPVAARLFPDEKRFQIAAALEPALTVGGDLYDFFLLDAQHLFFVIGDVSGKGVPASLFMAVSKALAKSVALRAVPGDSGFDLAQRVAIANHELSQENPEMLFVTAVIGVLDVATGQISLVNAGHDAPWRLAAGKPPEQIKTEGGPPLCAWDEFPYPVEQIVLNTGEALCLMTDGVTEAMDNSGQQYGTTRVAACLHELTTADADLDAVAIMQALRADVARFVSGATASDDLTLLVLRWMGPQPQQP